MTTEQARTLAQFINDHDPRFRAKSDESEKAENASVRCYARVENGGSGEDAAHYDSIGSYVEEARRTEEAGTAASFTVQLDAWLAEQKNDEQPA